MLEELITALGLEAEDEDEVTDDKEATATSLSDRKLEDEGAVPRPRVMALYIDVDDIMDNNIGLHFGLGNHRSLQGQGIKAYIDCALCFPTEVESVEAELRNAIHIQQPNNPPTIELIRFREDKMANSDSQKLERQKRRAAGLCVRIGHQLGLHKAIYSEAVKMRELITKLNLNDDTKNKEQRFVEHFNAIQAHVEHELFQVEDIKAMEQALEILTVAYPRLAAMLDELRYTFSLQGAMPMPHVLNLNIRVFDIMVDKLVLDLGLLGKISSLRGIKAHVICQFCFPTEVEEVEAKLRQAVDIHHPNNPPTLEIIRYAEDRMVKSDSDSQMLLERQKWKRTRLVDRVIHQKHLYNTLIDKVIEIVEQKPNTTLSDAPKHKEQRFREHFNAIKDRVAHELLRVDENIPNPNLKRLTEEIEDTERALQILTVEYPRLAAMLEELITALGLEAEDEDEVTYDKEAPATSLSDRKVEDEGAVPRPRVMALYIDVDDVMDNNIGLHFGLGNHRSLQGQGIKAYIDCALCFPTELESVEAELRHAIHIQQPNNPPTIEIIRFREDKMVNSDSQMLERQKRRAARLCVRIGHQQDLHNAIYSEAESRCAS
ncbi:uncharacterized protein [Miscanthus floridulus]|uniref:uncharacterized protein isoform X2 n=1 Tax=Miscanthus floridulus TaxID=154761 RepID=UPI00345B0D2B